MKRFIAILVALQIGLSPFCAVFAMESTQLPTDSTCAPMQEETALHAIHMDTHLACCDAKTSQESTIQTSTSIESTPQAVQATIFYPNDLDCYAVSRFTSKNSLHPPDDFERSSQSKRE